MALREKGGAVLNDNRSDAVQLEAGTADRIARHDAG
jgi:hypothetical protein